MAQLEAAQANRETIASGYEAFARGELDKVREIWSDDIEWVIPGRSPLAQTYRGAPEVMKFFERLMELSGGTFGLDIHDVLASDDHVMVLVSQKGQRNGRVLDDLGVHVWDMSGGKATRFIVMAGDAYEVDTFWS